MKQVNPENLENIPDSKSFWRRDMSDSERNVLEAIAELPLVKLLTKLQIGLLQDMVYDDLSVTAAAAKRGVTQAKARREVAKLRAVISTELEKLDKQECE